MNQIFIEPDQISDGYVIITGEEANHIANALRMHKGEKLRVCIPGDKAYLCEIASAGRGPVRARILDLDGTFCELSGSITLYQGLPKGDKMELIIQKAVELGAERIVPVAMTNCVVKLDAAKAQKKEKRYQAIAHAAASQSRRTRIPRADRILKFDQAVREACACDVVLVPYEMADADTMLYTKQVIEGILPGMSVGVFIGPEGGFDPKEITLLGQICGQKAKIISLGRRILRTETAGLTMLSLLMYHFETADAAQIRSGKALPKMHDGASAEV